AFYLPVTAATWGVGVWGRAVAEAAERDRRELAGARDAVRHERTQIARELQDIVAHSVHVMALLAEAMSKDYQVAPPLAEPKSLGGRGRPRSRHGGGRDR
ncbi:hypothetical protein VM98_34810, partial [Streptomyces rubellomurinus subsp. indigoferus]